MTLARAGITLGVAGLFLFGSNGALQNAVAEGDTRTISFHHLHTDEDIVITYKREGRYDEAALKKLDWFMRDWRREESIHMDPRLFDLLWETNREAGGTQPIQVVCGYRSPETNSMLRERSSGVAQFSQHTEGHAMDFYIPGVPLEKIRFVGLRLQRGGVGFYPTSGSPFVHLDTGSIRHWPRMTHDQLAQVFPDGRTVHIPSDGVPLKGYMLALADVERRGGTPSSTSLEAARDAGIVTASIEREAKKLKRSLLAGLFGGTKDEDVVSEQPAPKSAAIRPRAPAVVASLTPAKPVAVESIVPLPAARPAQPVVAAAIVPKPKPVDRAIALAAFDGNLNDSRPMTPRAVEVGGDLPPPEPAATYDVASADASFATGATPPVALAYAAEQPATTPTAKAKPMGAGVPQLPREASVARSPANTTVAVKRYAGLSGGGQRSDSPWLRAAILAPSIGAMTTSRLGDNDLRPLAALLRKPSQALALTFSADPYLGMVADRFTGSAVVFLATANFTPAMKTALK
jgi:uncharacterized protein YcbK (DUF882 family)